MTKQQKKKNISSYYYPAGDPFDGWSVSEHCDWGSDLFTCDEIIDMIMDAPRIQRDRLFLLEQSIFKRLRGWGKAYIWRSTVTDMAGALEILEEDLLRLWEVRAGWIAELNTGPAQEERYTFTATDEALIPTHTWRKRKGIWEEYDDEDSGQTRPRQRLVVTDDGIPRVVTEFYNPAGVKGFRWSWDVNSAKKRSKNEVKKAKPKRKKITAVKTVVARARPPKRPHEETVLEFEEI